jgi:hypothetical protein
VGGDWQLERRLSPYSPFSLRRRGSATLYRIILCPGFGDAPCR